MRLCYVCQKPVQSNELGHRPHRHERCKPGGLRWLAYFNELPPEKQTEAGKLLAKGAVERAIAAKERFTKLRESKDEQDG